jgi:hypothetical protein
VERIIEQKTEERKSRTSTHVGDEKNPEKRDLLDIMMDCRSEEGALLTREELAAHTKT